jgi:hypothetical protein
MRALRRAPESQRFPPAQEVAFHLNPNAQDLLLIMQPLLSLVLCLLGTQTASPSHLARESPSRAATTDCLQRMPAAPHSSCPAPRTAQRAAATPFVPCSQASPRFS